MEVRSGKSSLEDLTAELPEGSHHFLWHGYELCYFKCAWGELVFSLHGGQVLLFRPVDEASLLWTSAHPKGAPGAIRGGVPLCWPWFADHPTDRSKPAHGVARTSRWRIEHEEVNSSGAILVFVPEQTLWPDLELSLKLQVFNGELRLALTTTNQGMTAIPVTQALHTYLSVSNTDQIEIQGLAGCKSIDKLNGMKVDVQEGVLKIGQETDSIFEHSEEVVILDHGWQRAISVKKRSSDSTVVWNPGVSAALMSDIGSEQATEFVCVEAANTSFFDKAVINPGESVSLETSICVTDYPS